jgi:hypothetical protein
MAALVKLSEDFVGGRLTADEFLLQLIAALTAITDDDLRRLAQLLLGRQ